MQKEISCGAIIFRIVHWVKEYLIIQQKQGGHRFFPKGHVEIGESEEQTASREILEEVGLHVDFMPGFRETFSYIDYTKPVEKIVIFFLAESKSSDIILSDELQDFSRLSYQSALKRLTHYNSKETLMKAYTFLAE